MAAADGLNLQAFKINDLAAARPPDVYACKLIVLILFLRWTANFHKVRIW
jgi:hypothetical protein